MINNANYFKKQLKAGEDCEKDFKAFLESKDWTVTMTEGNFSDYDILAQKDGIEVTFEVKYNSGIEKYKTCFIEYYQSGLVSGLQKSKADYQIHYSEFGEVRCMRTDEVRKYIKDNNLSLKSTMMKTKSGKVSGQGYRIPFTDLTLIKK